ncbi:uncharacterized protein BJ171DRAFT_15147 [Polychytrium aggregatum]|uniref:uncharacterized protein n=1 Tax=Polychytrium aggregatum TaxID=110093 RepID=UPI0022FEF5E8|nr:uncharacterized protein BJ171DRAFT_15147 [Polychytrium aggregatum]KAI9206589.1 hypothetical protein BJ171DRAFT_15147 [Polychytrium aggregatum]
MVRLRQPASCAVQNHCIAGVGHVGSRPRIAMGCAYSMLVAVLMLAIANPDYVARIIEHNQSGFQCTASKATIFPRSKNIAEYAPAVVVLTTPASSTSSFDNLAFRTFPAVFYFGYLLRSLCFSLLLLSDSFGIQVFRWIGSLSITPCRLFSSVIL